MRSISIDHLEKGKQRNNNFSEVGNAISRKPANFFFLIIESMTKANNLMTRNTSFSKGKMKANEMKTIPLKTAH